MTLTITINLPDKCLHPNGGKRHHPMKVNRCKKNAQREAWAETLAALNGRTWRGPGTLGYEFHLYQAKQNDDDNLIAWMKASRDGIAMALGIDDNLLTTEKPQVVTERDRQRQRVVVTVTQLGGVA